MPENILFNNNDQKRGLAIAQNSGKINTLSEERIKQYEERIKELKQSIVDLKER